MEVTDADVENEMRVFGNQNIDVIDYLGKDLEASRLELVNLERV